MKVFLDANVLLDLVTERDDPQFTKDASVILSLGEDGALELFMSAITVPTIAYVIKKKSAGEKKRIIRDLTSIVSVLPSLPEHVDNALGGIMDDIEDALQVQSAIAGRCNVIITRDVDDFKLSEIPAISPEEFLKRILR